MGLDKKNIRSVNIAFPLKKSSKGAFTMNEETIEAVSDDLKILILTNYGERVVNYFFGANLREYLFEFIGDDLKQAIGDAILIAVEKWMPYVKIIDTKISTNEDDFNLSEHEIEIKVKFSVGETDLIRRICCNCKRKSLKYVYYIYKKEKFDLFKSRF